VSGLGRGPALVAAGLLLGRLILAPTSASSDPRTEAQKVVAGPDLTSRGGFAVTCSPSTWAKIVDHPALIGRLWELGGYSPAYKVSLRGDVIHIDDPTGLTGDFVVFDKRGDERRYWGRGRITHRAFPFLNTGQMVVVLRARPEGPRIVGSLEVFVRGDSTIARGALWTGRLLVQPRVDNRLRSNLIDVTHLIESLVNQPEAGLKLLQGATAEEFRALFVPPKPAPPPSAPRARPR
jgi:hypothetical protein